MNSYTVGYLLILCLILGACQNDLITSFEDPADNSQKSYANVDAELWPHFQNFEIEAARRNISADLARAGIIGTIEDIREDKVVGSCSYGGFARSHVYIDRNFWNRANYNSKEMIIFHELGHCFLFRDHLEGRLANGACISIMRSGTSACRDNYNFSTRDYYLDELFSVNNR